MSSRLTVHPGTPEAWEIQLRPGVNTLGRHATNDFPIQDSSVSGAHCEITVGTDTATLRDLGSTNGTFVSGTRVQEATLRPGLHLQLGNVELIYEEDEPTRSASEPRRMRVTAPSVASQEPQALIPIPPPVPGTRAMSAPQRGEETSTPGAHYCRSHPKSPARALCPQCQRYHCVLCVNTRIVSGVARQFCRACGGECTPVEFDLAQTLRARPEKSFFEVMPSAFVYPFRGIGPFYLVFLGLLIPGVEWVARFFTYALIAAALLWGFFFACFQNFVLCTAHGEETPAWPDVTSVWQDLLSPLFRFVGLGVLVFGPAIVLAGAAAFGQTWAGWAAIPALGLGAIYFPMALLAVAMFDSLVAVNPRLVVPSILRVPLHYLVVLALFGLGTLTQMGGEWLADARLGGNLVAIVFSNLFGFYFFAVQARLLGLLYRANKEKLGWFR